MKTIADLNQNLENLQGNIDNEIKALVEKKKELVRTHEVASSIIILLPMALDKIHLNLEDFRLMTGDENYESRIEIKAIPTEEFKFTGIKGIFDDKVYDRLDRRAKSLSKTVRNFLSKKMGEEFNFTVGVNSLTLQYDRTREVNTVLLTVWFSAN